MEFIIYSDESVSQGDLFSDFFGGALVTSEDLNDVNAALEAKKQELNLFGEIKWTKVSVNYLEKYRQMMDLFFSFIKHAFGLPYHDRRPGERIYLRLFFDQIADSDKQNDAFRSHVEHLQKLWLFRKAGIIIRPEDIVEIDSHKHPIQQCMDIVLGAVAFRLNNKLLAIPEGQCEPGKKTKAKEELFNYILHLIKNMNGVSDFDISQTTLPDNAKSRWRTPYRHWRFISAEYRETEV